MTRFLIGIFLIGLGLFFSAPAMVESIVGREIIDETTVPDPLRVLGAIMVIVGAYRLFDIGQPRDCGDEECATGSASRD